ncbi:MAG: hypothetical protein NVS1B14_04160 [Vulcanimicrobiaceae bacterium]
MTRPVQPFNPDWWKRPVVRLPKTCTKCGVVCNIDVRFREQWKICPACAAERLRAELCHEDMGQWPI